MVFASAALGHPLEDLLSALGEVLDDRARHAFDVGHAPLHRLPRDPEAVGQLVTQNGLMEEARGARLVVEVATVERGPPTVRATRE